MANPEPIRFHIDPLCPWCYQTARWVSALERRSIVTVDWAVFSLELVNSGTPTAVEKGHARSEASLRTAITARAEGGAPAVGRFYAELGAAVHQRGEAVDDPEVIVSALEAADLPAALLDKALQDDTTWVAVVAEHRGLVERTRSFGVPTIVLDGGDGPAIFGPVVSEVPAEADVEPLWRHVSWLTRYANFSELKRDRVAAPDLESVRRRA